MLDAATGELATQLLAVSAYAASGVNSYGLLLQGDGNVFLALNLANEEVEKEELKLRVASFNLQDGSSVVLGGPGSYLVGYSAALVRDKSEEKVYLGGSYKLPFSYNAW